MPLIDKGFRNIRNVPIDYNEDFEIVIYALFLIMNPVIRLLFAKNIHVKGKWEVL